MITNKNTKAKNRVQNSFHLITLKLRFPSSHVWSFENYPQPNKAKPSQQPLLHILKYIFCEQLQGILGKKISLQPKKEMKID